MFNVTSFSPVSSQKLTANSQQLFQEFLNQLVQFRLRRGADDFAWLGVGLEEEQGGNALDAQCTANILRLINVDFVYNKLTFVLRGETFHDGRKLTARTAPISVEIDHARDSALVTESLRRIYVGNSIQKLAGCERDDLAREILSRSLIVFSLHRIHVTVIVFDSSRLRFGLRRLLRRAFLSAGSEYDCREKS